MTGGEERVLYSCVTLMIFLLCAGITIGIYFSDAFHVMPHDEDYFQKQSSKLYSLALDYMDEKSKSGKTRICRELLEKIDDYNLEASEVDDWNFRCRKSFSLEYLLGDWNL